MNEFISSETGQAVIAIAAAAASAAFTAMKGLDFYERMTNRRQRIIIDLVAKAVAYVYTHHVRPTKAANPDGKLTSMEKHKAEDKAVQFIVAHAEDKGIKIDHKEMSELRGAVVQEVARVKSAIRTTPSTKGGL